MSENQSYSHPDQAVRHSYPLHVTDDGFSAAMSLCMKTMPFILLRLGLLVGFTLVTIIWFGVSLGIASLFGEGAAFPALLFGFGIPAGVFMWFRKYVLYMLKAAHIAVLTRFITHGELGSATDQVKYGKEIVTSRFGEVNMLFVLDSLVEGVVRSFNRTLNWVGSLLPIPGLDSLMDIINKVMEKATTYIDETIFSYNLARDDENKWRSAKDGLIYYGQNWKPVLKTAAWALILEYVLTFVLFIICLAPAWAINAIFPAMGGWVTVFAFLFALNIRAAVLHPLFLTMVALTFHKEIQNQEINPEVDATLTKVSDKFQELSEKAQSWVAEQKEKYTSGSSEEQATQPPATA